MNISVPNRILNIELQTLICSDLMPDVPLGLTAYRLLVPPVLSLSVGLLGSSDDDEFGGSKRTTK
jgi:hypothetical protein